MTFQTRTQLSSEKHIKTQYIITARRKERRERRTEKKKKSFHAPVHIGVTNTAVHYHYYINQCHSHSIWIDILNSSIHAKVFILITHLTKKKKKLSPKPGTGNKTLLTSNLKRLC